MKKGQVTPFIIVGILLVILIVVVVVFLKPVQIGGRLSETQIQPVKNYIDECIKNSVDESLDNIRIYGGYLTESNAPELMIEGVSVLVEKGGGTIRPQRHNSVIGDKIKEELEKDLIGCKVEDYFDDFSISVKTPEAEVNILDKSVNVNVNWVVNIRKGIRTINLQEFSYVREDDIGWVNSVVVNDILDEVLKGNEVEKDGVIKKWIEEGKYNDIFFTENGDTKGIDVSSGTNNFGDYIIYAISTKFSRERELNEFKFAIKE